MPRPAILTSSVIGFLCVIAAAVWPDTVFLFLLNSSGAVILFVYLLIAISQIVLRRRTSPDKLIVKMWLFPALSIIVVVAILAVLVQMAVNADARPQLILSLLAWAVLIVLFVASKRLRNRPTAESAAEPTGEARRVLVLANETVEGAELLDELRAIDRAGKAEYFVCVPANPIDTGQAMHQGAVYMWDATCRRPRTGSIEPSRFCTTNTSPRPASSATTDRYARWPTRWNPRSRPAGHLHPPGGAVGLAAV